MKVPCHRERSRRSSGGIMARDAAPGADCRPAGPHCSPVLHVELLKSAYDTTASRCEASEKAVLNINLLNVRVVQAPDELGQHLVAPFPTMRRRCQFLG